MEAARPSRFRLDERVAVVTGARSGLGRAIAAGLAEMGARVAAVDIKPAGATDETRRALAVLADVTDEEQVRAAVAQVQRDLGRVDILVNCAGVIYKDVVEKLDRERWLHVLAVNLTGPMLCAKHVVPLMKAGRWGRIVNISSMMAVTAAETYSAYCASKAGLLQLTRVWALELAPFGITVNALCPGWITTPMAQGFIDNIARIHGLPAEGGLEKILSLVPQRRFLDPAEVADAAAFLSSEAGRGITGAGIVIDAGTTAGMPYGVHRRLDEALGVPDPSART